MKYFPIIFLIVVFLYFTSFAQEDTDTIPRVWMTYYDGRNLEEDFRDMKKHGIDAVEVGIWGIEGNSRPAEILQVARKTGMKLIIGIPEISEEAFSFDKDKVERAVMMGGAFGGKAIDRFRFSFTAEKHSISIESPVYDSTNCYGNIGRYFMGLTPLKAEVVVKKADFDGKQHLEIVPARISPQKENFWNMEFDLTGIKGDLDNVVLAVYWISGGTRDYWIFGDAVSMFSNEFKIKLQDETAKIISAWKLANQGQFPSEVVAVRYGDECFHISGHLNSEDCSFPMWDFSESAIQHFNQKFKGEFPRGVGWTDMFGHEAYAQWMYNFHEAAAQSVNLVKTTLEKEGAGNVPVFRNTTRMNIFDVMNDWDGSGQDLLSQQFELLHLDPYPVSDKGYDEKLIPRDMEYMEGLSRRYNKKIVPWMQAHVYGQLNHPRPEHITKMINQQKCYSPEAIIWLGYGGERSGNSFPGKKDSWEQAAMEHVEFKNHRGKRRIADFALIRPYSVRSVRGVQPEATDRIFTDLILEKAVFDQMLKFDPFEPLVCGDIPAETLEKYSFVIAEIGILNKKNLAPFQQIEKTVILCISGAEYEKGELQFCGIKKVAGNTGNFGFIKPTSDLQLENDVVIHRKADNRPVIWQKNNLIFVNHYAEKSLDGMFAEIFNEVYNNLIK
jgi:hypothetical protein